MGFNRSLLPLFTITLAASSALGQATSGDLVGTVKDASGAVIPNAQITITSETTGVAVNIKSTTSGEFRAGNLLPAAYDLLVQAPGFQSYDLKGLAVDLNKTATANVSLAVTGSNTSVEVSATAGVVLDTTSTNLTTTFSSQELDTLPTVQGGYGVLNASLLAPNVASPGGAGIGTGPSVGGQRPRNNNYTIEGIDNNDKSVTGPLINVPNDAVSEFTLITSQFSPEFGHSSGGQFNVNVLSGTNKFHGKAYEYFDNKDLNAEAGIAGGKSPNTRYDDNRYGGQVGGPIVKDKLFFFFNYERHTTGQSSNYFLCTPTAAGLASLNAVAGTYGFSQTNLSTYAGLTPAATVNGGAQVDASQDLGCFQETTGGQYLTVGGPAYSAAVSNGGGVATGYTGPQTQIPLGNAHLTPASFANVAQYTGSIDFTPTQKDSFRFRYNYYNEASKDLVASLPIFQGFTPDIEHLLAFSWFHTFTPNLVNEFRVGYNRFYNVTPVAGPGFPGLDSFPNFTIYDQEIDIGPDDNAPQSTIQNLYQLTNNVSYTKGKHTLKFGFDGRKYISPQNFVQRQRGDYEWYDLSGYLNDLAPDYFGERSAGGANYAGDQTAFYGYGNDTWRATPKLTINYGLRYEFTSVPAGERKQSLNAISNDPGLIVFNAPKPQYTNFAPRVGLAYAPDDKTSVRAGFGMAYDVLFDNLGLLTSPPQLSQTHDVGNTAAGDPDYLSPNFLANGGLPNSLVAIPDQPSARAATAAYLPNQVLPYSINYNLTVQRVFNKNYTAELQYLGTRGVHLPTQNQTNVTPEVNADNQLTTYLTGPVADASGSFATIATGADAHTLGAIQAAAGDAAYITPAYYNDGFVSKITSYQPYGGSNYNGLGLNVTRRFVNGFQMNASYTYSKAMDDSTAEVNASDLTQRRPQDSRNQHAEYARSALDRAQRLTIEAVYDVPYFKHSNWLLKNVVGNWAISPIYTYETPEYVTVSSEANSNLNGDSAAISRTYVNATGNKQAGSAVIPVYSTTLAGNCAGGAATCSNNLVGYLAEDPSAYYIVAGKGVLPNSERNTLAGRPIDNVTVAAQKRINFTERYAFEFSAQAYNVLNHAQYVPGTIDNIGGTSTAGVASTYLGAGSAVFNKPELQWGNHARTMQLAAKLIF